MTESVRFVFGEFFRKTAENASQNVNQILLTRMCRIYIMDAESVNDLPDMGDARCRR